MRLESDPREFIRALRTKLKARPMRYFSEGGYGCWIADPIVKRLADAQLAES